MNLYSKKEGRQVWAYYVITGDIAHGGYLLGKGYSGYGGFCNNPDLEFAFDRGPIPRGRYKIGYAEHNHKMGPYAMSLTPVGHTAYGRSGFYIHGDSKKQPGAASTGCIILPHNIRKMIAHSGDHDLEVI
jgi:hypothetical protein